MKTLFLIPLAAAFLSAGEYSKQDRETAVNRLQDTRRLIAQVASGLTIEQGNFKPSSSVWSVTEVIEHLGLIEDLLFGILKETIEKGKPVPDDQKLPDPSAVDKTILDRVPDRGQKAQAPEQAVPKGTYTNWEQALRGFGETRGKTVVYVQALKQDLRRYHVESPMGKLDGHQWLLLLTAHTERHAKQIEEAMQHEMFPKPN